MKDADRVAEVKNGRRERRKVEVRNRLIESAISLFSEKGFNETTVEDITEAADVAKGTFFNYFPSKEHVLGALVDLQVTRVNEALAAAKTGRRTRDVLNDLTEVLPRLPGRSRTMTRSLMSGLAGSETVRSVFLPGMKQGREVLAEVFKIGQQRGDIRTDLDAAALAFFFQQSMFGAVMFWSIGGAQDLPVVVEHAFRVMWSGVVAEGRQAPREQLL